MGMTGLALQKWREENDYTYHELAIELRVSVQEIVDWEKSIKPTLPNYLMHRLRLLERTPEQAAQIRKQKEAEKEF